MPGCPSLIMFRTGKGSLATCGRHVTLHNQDVFMVFISAVRSAPHLPRELSTTAPAKDPKSAIAGGHGYRNGRKPKRAPSSGAPWALGDCSEITSGATTAYRNFPVVTKLASVRVPSRPKSLISICVNERHGRWEGRASPSANALTKASFSSRTPLGGLRYNGIRRQSCPSLLRPSLAPWPSGLPSRSPSRSPSRPPSRSCCLAATAAARREAEPDSSASFCI
mmetsp:Transcript_47304/g.94314  ORF Transcript_47304/g.94314 Transcript_47304/m.94314 type:complete len:223 (-) Transcript_47304:1191-1859(-)